MEIRFSIKDNFIIKQINLWRKKIMKTFLFITLLFTLATTLVGQEISFTLTPEEEAEKASWIAKGLMYPKYGYDKVSWGDGVDEVKKHYTGLVNASDEDSLFGMRKFSQKVSSGGDG